MVKEHGRLCRTLKFLTYLLFVDIISESLKIIKKYKLLELNYYAPVAQLDRVPDYESVGWRFESSRARGDNMPQRLREHRVFSWWLGDSVAYLYYD